MRKSDKSAPRSISPEYLAALIDGEGCIRIAHYQRPYQFQLVVTIKMNAVAEPLIRQIHEEHGGTFYVPRVYTTTRKEGPQVQVRWSGGEAAKLLATVGPYLRLNGLRKELALMFEEERVGDYRNPGRHAKHSEWYQNSLGPAVHQTSKLLNRFE